MSDCWANRGDGCSGLGGNAVGSWAREPLLRVIEDQTPQKEAVLLRDQLRTGGLRAELWLGVSASETNMQCACYKQSFQQADRKCSSCHGVGYVPGYLKWGYNTYWMSATDPGITFVNTEVTRTFKSAKVQLTGSALTGTVESSDFIFNRTAVGSVWEYDNQVFIRDSENSSTIGEYSLDSGATWFDLSLLSGSNPASGMIRFRVTLNRSTSAIRSPLWEITRARFSRIPLGTFINPYTGSPRNGPWILVMSGYPDQQYVKSEHGDLPQGGTSFWTSGMSMFDPEVVVGSEEELIHGPNIVVKFLDGVLAGRRYRPTSWKQTDPFGFKVTVQDFQVRESSSVESYAYVW
jgi:hypothetical protein